MDLILWRHADAENRMPDNARQLTSRGRKEAEKMATWLAGQLPGSYRVIVSPALRTRETAAALTDAVIVDEAVSTAATPQDVLKTAGWPDGAGTVIVVGHQPTLGEAVALALTGEVAAWKFEKGAIWWIKCDTGGDVEVRAMLTPSVM